MSNVKIIHAENQQRPSGFGGSEELILEVSIEGVYGQRRMLDTLLYIGHRMINSRDESDRYREHVIRDMARGIAAHVEKQIIEALEAKARQARPVTIVDAFK